MYCTKSDVQNYLMMNIDSSFDTQIDNWISAAEAWINNYCNREFEQESATYKVYDGNGTRELLIDDLLTLTKIETLDLDGDVDETIDSSDMYYLYPANKTPKYRIVLNSSNSPIAIFPSGHQNIKVTGTFGYSTTATNDIRLATAKIVAGIIEEKNMDVAGGIKKERLGEYNVELRDIGEMANRLGITDLLDRYRIFPI